MEIKSKESAPETITGTSFRSGQTLQWIKLKSLGEGSHGFVDLVKLINPHVTRLLAFKSSPSPSPSLQKEFRVLRQLLGCTITTNNNIVGCYDQISSFEYGFEYDNLVLDYAPGGNLRNLIDKHGGKIPESDVIHYTKMILEGLRHVHEKGYVHCDVKPENILVYPSGSGSSLCTLKIADFGTAKEPGEKTEQHTNAKNPLFRGTANYMSPESVGKGEITASLDIWSLGCVVVEMMTGKSPWESVTDDLEDLSMKIGFSEDLPADLPEDMSKEGKDFLMRCFARDPHQRWTSQRLINHPFLFPDDRNRTLLMMAPKTLLLPPHLLYRKFQEVDQEITISSRIGAKTISD